MFKPEVNSLNMGSINFGLYHLAPSYGTFKVDWEKPHLEATRDLVFRNAFKDIAYVRETCYGNGTRFAVECYDIAHLSNLSHFADRGLVKAPFAGSSQLRIAAQSAALGGNVRVGLEDCGPARAGSRPRRPNRSTWCERCSTASGLPSRPRTKRGRSCR